jgi:hypothetical protein
MHNNKYDIQTLDKVISTINMKTQAQTQNVILNTKSKWATFTYVGQQTKFIIVFFKYQPKNTIQNK